MNNPQPTHTRRVINGIGLILSPVRGEHACYRCEEVEDARPGLGAYDRYTGKYVCRACVKRYAPEHYATLISAPPREVTHLEWIEDICRDSQ